ncbi:MAG: DUF1440 domain-containing protein [Rhizobiaceae bacterium]|nr:DUF1440 domain-containing protein [Rhizobiaceae bacterium]MCV0406494.1 DUF1440 domain-containing protein [Rhizobiaceae bacterium]
MNRLVNGAIAGFCATMAMTMAMRVLAQRLAYRDRYPLPPREITQDVLEPGEQRMAALTLLAHFGFGAFAGTLYELLSRRIPGLLFGPLVWAVSYLGWVPLSRILTPATRHPAERNLLMIAVHLVWGVCLALGTRELDKASRSIFAAGRLEDRQKG